ncbi:hypothetical protein CbC4_0383 [Clostridium botulinum BKT015925]|nr:hypothetical protein [Clostridium botulinum]AEB75063.1 hypothetical protein CbC4_0383 [Clostridium botulinum BKT015925]
MGLFMYQDVQAYYDYIPNIVDKNLSINDGMNELINYCNKKCESDIWKELRELDFNEDKESLIKWIEENLQDSPPEDHIDCLYFNLKNDRNFIFIVDINEKQYSIL